MTALPALAAAPARPPGTAADSASSDEGGAFAAALERARDPAPAEGAAKNALKGAAKAGSGADAKTSATTEARADDGGDDEAATDETKPGGAAPDLAAWLPGWPAAPATALPAKTSSIASEHAIIETDASKPAPATLAGTTRSEGPGLTTATAADAPIAPTSRASADKASDLVAAASDLALQADTSRAADSAAAAVPVWPALLPGAAAQAATHNAHVVGAGPAAPFEARLAAALDSAAFAPALATQVTWLASEGVQHARLSLNPLEMGPLAVKIILDGNQARIDFTADMAGTRAAIEASLPSLAAALNEHGLTLAGGGVFDGQARHGAQGGPGQRHAQPPGHAAEAGLGNPGASTATNLAVRAGRGLVDLVA